MVAKRGFPGPGRRVRGLIGGVVAAGIMALGFMGGAGQASAGLFGSQEVERDGAFATFGKWHGVVERVGTEKQVVPPPCRGRDYDACPYPEWETFIETARGQDRLSQLKSVARYFDRLQYIEDQPNWGVPDYWATPGQFLSRNGDCEDFAISKYETLLLLGWPASDLRIVYVQDMNLQVGHMILAATLHGTTYILDNQARNQLIRHERIRHYRPVYSLSQDRWWRHMPSQ